MCMNLSLRSYTAVCETEGRDGKVKIFLLPGRLSKWKLLSKSSLVNLNDLDSVLLQVKNLISDCKCYLRNGLLD